MVVSLSVKLPAWAKVMSIHACLRIGAFVCGYAFVPLDAAYNPCMTVPAAMVGLHVIPVAQVAIACLFILRSS